MLLYTQVEKVTYGSGIERHPSPLYPFRKRPSALPQLQSERGFYSHRTRSLHSCTKHGDIIHECKGNKSHLAHGKHVKQTLPWARTFPLFLFLVAESHFMYCPPTFIYSINIKGCSLEPLPQSSCCCRPGFTTFCSGKGSLRKGWLSSKGIGSSFGSRCCCCSCRF